MVKVAVLGAAGRMGRAVLSCVFEANDLKLVGALAETSDPVLGRDGVERVAAAQGRKLADLAVYARHGQTGPRVPGTIGFSVARGGNVVGEHAVRFIAAEEEVVFSHRAGDRKTFARGALRAARWVAGRAPGLYSLADVLGLSRE